MPRVPKSSRLLPCVSTQSRTFSLCGYKEHLLVDSTPDGHYLEGGLQPKRLLKNPSPGVCGRIGIPACLLFSTTCRWLTGKNACPTGFFNNLLKIIGRCRKAGPVPASSMSGCGTNIEQKWQMTANGSGSRSCKKFWNRPEARDWPAHWKRRPRNGNSGRCAKALEAVAKPLWSTVRARLQACRQELGRNRALAPEVLHWPSAAEAAVLEAPFRHG